MSETSCKRSPVPLGGRLSVVQGRGEALVRVSDATLRRKLDSATLRDSMASIAPS